MNKKIYMILAVLWMAFIFYMSNQPAHISSAQSGGFTKMLTNVPFISGFVNHLIDTGFASVVIRKLAHMFSYCFLAILLFMSMYKRGCNIKRLFIKALIFTFLYATTDELHQIFVDGRSGELKDVFIDSVGGFIGLLILSSIIYLKRKKKKI